METAIKVFEQGLISDNLPSVQIDEEILSQGIMCIDLLCNAGITTSKGEARRLIRGMGVKINDILVQDENLIINLSYLKDRAIKLSSGKKKHILVKL